MKTFLEFVSSTKKSIGFLLHVLIQNWKVEAINFEWTTSEVTFELFLPQNRRVQFSVHVFAFARQIKSKHLQWRQQIDFNGLSTFLATKKVVQKRKTWKICNRKNVFKDKKKKGFSEWNLSNFENLQWNASID